MAAKRQVHITPLLAIQSTEFAKQYEDGVWWSMYGDEQGNGPVPASYLVTNLKRYAKYRYFQRHGLYYYYHIGFLLGMYHGGILSPARGLRRSDVTTLAQLDHQEAERGYYVGREAFFVDAHPHEHIMTESYLIERLQESVNEMDSFNDGDETWFYSIGNLLGELSGHLFPLTEQDHLMWKQLNQQRQETSIWWKVSQEQHTEPLHLATLQEA